MSPINGARINFISVSIEKILLEKDMSIPLYFHKGIIAYITNGVVVTCVRKTRIAVFLYNFQSIISPPLILYNGATYKSSKNQIKEVPQYAIDEYNIGKKTNVLKSFIDYIYYFNKLFFKDYTLKYVNLCLYENNLKNKKYLL